MGSVLSLDVGANRIARWAQAALGCCTGFAGGCNAPQLICRGTL
jgi:hypothetical protein